MKIYTFKGLRFSANARVFKLVGIMYFYFNSTAEPFRYFCMFFFRFFLNLESLNCTIQGLVKLPTTFTFLELHNKMSAPEMLDIVLLFKR